MRLGGLIVFAGFCFAFSYPAAAVPVVTFYNNQASFMAAIPAPTVLDFEGIVADGQVLDCGSSYHAGKVTISGSVFGSPRSVDIVGKSADALGRPFDSAFLNVSVTGSTMLITSDPGTNTTAIGGYFLNQFGPNQSNGTFKLTGSTGLLDQRSLLMGIASSGSPKTFFGFVVTGDTITSLSIEANAPTVDNLTYVPEPTSLAPLLAMGLCAIRSRQVE